MKINIIFACYSNKDMLDYELSEHRKGGEQWIEKDAKLKWLQLLVIAIAARALG